MENKVEFTKDNATKYICSEIKHICTDFEKRFAGEEGEKQTAEYLADSLKDSCDVVKLELFKLHPAAFSGWIYVTYTCFILSMAAYFFSAMVSIVVMLAGILPFIVEFLLYKRGLDPLFPEKKSQNVTAIRKCEGELQRRILFNAHIDAAKEWSINYRLGGLHLRLHMFFSVIGAVILFVLNIARWALVGGIGAEIASGPMLYVGFAMLVFVPIWFVSYFIYDPKRTVDGANDDLSGCLVAMSVLKALEERGIRLENTEVGVVLTGGKEVGLRGAKAWCEKHTSDFADVQTLIVTLDTLRETQFININKSDMNSFVKTDSDVCALLREAAKKADVSCTERSMAMRVTDSAAFCQGGFKSASLTALNKNIPQYYHTRLDSYDNLNEDCIGKCFELALKAVEVYSGQQLFVDDVQPQEVSEEPLQEINAEE